MNQVESIFQKSKNPKVFARNYLNYLSNLLTSIDEESIANFIDLLIETRKNGNQCFFIGNGGSAATSMHFANDLGVGLRDSVKPLKVISLVDNIAAITAVANDYGYDEVFTRQLRIFLNPGDIVVAISASGNSKNLILAVDYAKAMGCKTVGLLGFDGGKLLGLCDLVIHAKTAGGEYGPVEDIHMIVDHLVNNYLFQYLKVLDGKN